MQEEWIFLVFVLLENIVLILLRRALRCVLFAVYRWLSSREREREEEKKKPNSHVHIKHSSYTVEFLILFVCMWSKRIYILLFGHFDYVFSYFVELMRRIFFSFLHFIVHREQRAHMAIDRTTDERKKNSIYSQQMVEIKE